MKVTVRTLDSKSTTFDVDEDETVKQFKEKIAPKLGIPVESQRVIFKGRVLHDEKLMKDYNVDGCVVHLVQRAPPSSTQSSSTASRGTTTSTSRSSTDHQSNVFIGAFQGANDMTNVTQQLVENLLSTFGGAHGAATVTTSSMGNGTAVNVQINMQADHQHSLPSDAEQRLQQAQRFIRSARTRLQNFEMGADSASAMDIDEPAQTQTSATRNESGAGAGENQSSINNSPQSLANTIKDFQELYRQLEPSLNRYQELLNNPKSENRNAADDSLPDGIAEVFHNLSHGLHALSDLTFNFHAPEPQTVGCFPRMSPVTMPQSNPQRTNTSASSQSGTNSAPTNTQSTVGQPHFHVQPHSHMHIHRHTEAGAGNGNSDFHRPIGVSATVIQIPRFQTASGLPQTSSTSNANSNAPSFSTSAAPFSFPSLFSSVQQSMSTGMPQLFRPQGTVSATSSSSNAQAADGVNVTAPSSGASSQPPSSTTARPQPSSQGTTTGQRTNTGLPFGFNPFGQSPLAGHPDPLVPCQSFHFGPRFQQAGGQLQAGRQIVAEVSSVMIEHIHSGVQSQASSDQTSVRNSMPSQETSSNTPLSSGAASTPSTVPSGHSLLGQSLASTLLNDIMANHSFSQQQQQQRPNEQQRTQAASNEGHQPHFHSFPDSDDDFDDDEELIDVNDTGRIYEEVQRAVASALSGSGQSQTIRDFIESRITGISSDEDTEEDRDDVMMQLMGLVAEHLTVNDILQIVLGGSIQPLVRVAPQFLRFVETNFNGGERLTRDNVERVTENISQRMSSHREILNSLNNKPDVDLPATIGQIDSSFCREALTLLIDHESPSFVERISSLFKRYLGDAVAVLDHCITGGPEAYLRAYSNSETGNRMLSNLDPGMRDMFTSMLVTKVRSAAQSVPPLSPDELQSKLIKKNQGVKKKQQSKEDDKLEPQATTADKKDKKDEDRRKIDVNKLWEERNGSLANNENDDDDDDHQVASEYQEWHRHVPPEWIAVITKDAKRQRAQSTQRPFSDAYYNGLPAKRRKAIGEARNNDRGVDFSAALQNSIASANAQPLTSQSDLLNDMDQQDLSQAFQETFREDARRRLEQDPDYKPTKFPKSHEYFFKK